MPKPKGTKPCSVDGCGAYMIAKSFCNKHWLRWWKYGSPTAGDTYKGETGEWCRTVAIHHVGDECLIWPFSRSAKGYGSTRVNGESVGAHRYVCELVNGPVPVDGMVAAHSCGKGHHGCVSPFHLRWATHHENCADKITHGTALDGELLPQSKLTIEKVKLAKSMRSEGLFYREIADHFSVAPDTIRSAILGKTWRCAT